VRPPFRFVNGYVSGYVSGLSTRFQVTFQVLEGVLDTIQRVAEGVDFRGTIIAIENGVGIIRVTPASTN
jgi:hypothetical protein